MFIIPRVRYYSQFKNVAVKSRRNKTCSHTVLKMGVEKVAKKRLPPIDRLYEEVRAIQRDMRKKGTLTDKVIKAGASHDVLAAVARNHGSLARRGEFRAVEVNLKARGKKRFSQSKLDDRFYNAGLRKIRESIWDGCPVAVSIKRGFDPAGTDHQVLLIGFDPKVRGRFVYLDPDHEGKASRKQRVVEPEAFRLCWKRLAIFFEPLA